MSITFNTEDRYLCSYLLAKYYDYRYGRVEASDKLIDDMTCGRIHEIIFIVFDNDKNNDYIDVVNHSVKILKDDLQYWSELEQTKIELLRKFQS